MKDVARRRYSDRFCAPSAVFKNLSSFFLELFSLLYQYSSVILISTVLATHFSLTLTDKIEIELMLLSNKHKDRLRFSSLTDNGAIAKLSGNLSDYVKLYGQIREGTQNPSLHIPAFFYIF
jgi:hypothetical protein